MNDWCTVFTNPDLTISELLSIINEGLDMYFEFKVENHTLFTRERVD